MRPYGVWRAQESTHEWAGLRLQLTSINKPNVRDRSRCGDGMEVIPLNISDVKLIRPRRHEDVRGFFSEIYNRRALADAGICTDFVQDNFSMSLAAGTVRGLHFQIPPAAQAKLVMVLSGRILDVVVDCRKGSASFGRHVAIELGREAWNQIFVPIGFAHGFCTLEEDTAVLYKVTEPFSPQLDSGILWNDP